MPVLNKEEESRSVLKKNPQIQLIRECHDLKTTILELIAEDDYQYKKKLMHMVKIVNNIIKTVETSFMEEDNLYFEILKYEEDYPLLTLRIKSDIHYNTMDYINKYIYWKTFSVYQCVDFDYRGENEMLLTFKYVNEDFDVLNNTKNLIFYKNLL